jgi:hypothetical protein
MDIIFIGLMVQDKAISRARLIACTESGYFNSTGRPVFADSSAAFITRTAS